MQAQFGADVASEGASHVIRVRGELDLDECPRLEQLLAAAEASQAVRIVLDLEELTFIDGSGLGVLLAASRRSSRNGSRLRITPARADVARIFRFLSFDQLLPLAPYGLDLNEAA